MRYASLLVPVLVTVSATNAQDWAQQLIPTPPGLYEAKMAFDPIRNTMVLFGGRSTLAAWPPPASLQHTWELQNGTWSQRAPAASPPGRSKHAMVFVPGLNIVVLFGGEDGNGSPLNDVWWWDGVNWHTAYYANAPTARVSPSIASENNVVIVFGGWSPVSGYLGDTWGWSLGGGWSQSPSSGPAPRRNAAFARTTPVFIGSYWYTRYVLHGGRSASVSNLGDTWIYGPGGWTQLPNAGGPAREQHVAAWDPLSQQTFLCSGQVAPTASGFADDLWRFDGQRWIEMPTATRPAQTVGAGVAMDTTRNRLVLLGGGTGAGLSALSNEQWEFTPPMVPQAFGSPCTPAINYYVIDFAARDRTWSGGFSVANGSGMTFALFAVGFSNSTWNGASLPVSLGVLGMPSCQLLVEPGWLQLVALQSGFLGSSGSFTLPIPSSPSLYGVELYTQAFAGNANGLVMGSSGWHVVIW